MSHHIMPFATNVKVFITLVFLTLLTVYTAKFVDLGDFNLVLAMFIASVKGFFVLNWFMHLKHDTATNKFIILSTVFFLVLLGGICYSDLFFRT
jgi:cytochrome c oxidase subunit 4